ncbi:MAG: hypothetical protein AAF208_05770 [Cyanobacteria bacterium P01_A01_bin.45]
MNILLIEQYSKFIQDIIQCADDLLREVVSDDKVRQQIKHEWYTDNDNLDWNKILKNEIASYSFDPSIYPDNFFNE